MINYWLCQTFQFIYFDAGLNRFIQFRARFQLPMNCDVGIDQVSDRDDHLVAIVHILWGPWKLPIDRHHALWCAQPSHCCIYNLHKSFCFSQISCSQVSVDYKKYSTCSSPTFCWGWWKGLVQVYLPVEVAHCLMIICYKCGCCGSSAWIVCGGWLVNCKQWCYLQQCHHQ
jgi:hypothetical protein